MMADNIIAPVSLAEIVAGPGGSTASVEVPVATAEGGEEARP